LTGRGVGEWLAPPELEEDDASELERLLLSAEPEPNTEAEASRELLNKLASFLRGEGLPGRCVAAATAAAAAIAGAEAGKRLKPGGEIANEPGGDTVVLPDEWACCCCC
jgi:hypothetical protein